MVLSVNTRQIDAGNRRLECLGARGKDELVVGKRVFAFRLEITDGHFPFLRVDPHGFMKRPDIEAEPLFERFGRLENEVVPIFDDVSDMVGQSAVGETDVRTAFENDDVGMLVETTGPGGGRCSSGNPADDHNSSVHFSFLLW